MAPEQASGDRYNGLRSAEATLPAESYRDPAWHQRDLDTIWYRNWIMVCREAEIAQPLAWRIFTIGTQEILVLRDDKENCGRFSIRAVIADLSSAAAPRAV